MRKGSVKYTRINEEVLRTLSEIIREDVKDPRISEMTSVVSTEVAPDLKTAKIYISVLGDQEAADKTMEGLKSSSGFIRHQLASKLNLRNTPELTFINDNSIAYGVRMSALINKVNADIPDRSGEDEANED